MKNRRFVAQLRNVTLECDTWLSLALACVIETIDLQTLLATSMDESEPLKCHINLVQKKGMLFFVDRDACFVNFDCLRALLSRYRDICNQDKNRLAVEAVRLAAVEAAPANCSEDDLNSFFAVFFFR